MQEQRDYPPIKGNALDALRIREDPETLDLLKSQADQEEYPRWKDNEDNRYQ